MVTNHQLPITSYQLPVTSYQIKSLEKKLTNAVAIITDRGQRTDKLLTSDFRFLSSDFCLPTSVNNTFG
jgi:hypothetical protein